MKNALTYSFRLVTARIIHDDDIIRFKCGHGLLIDIGAEAFAVDGTVKHTRGSHTRGSELVAAPGCKEGYGAQSRVTAVLSDPIPVAEPYRS